MLHKADVDTAYAAAQKVVETHMRLAKFLRPGMTLGQIDTFVAKTLEEIGCKSCFLHYKTRDHPPFPSHACLSVNECVVHGTAGYYTEPIGPGDLLKIDIGVWYKGFIGDAAWTYFVPPISAEAARLLQAGKESIALGVKELRPTNTWSAWAHRVSEVVEGKFGFHLTQGLGGHEIGRELHVKRGTFVSNSPQSAEEWPDGARYCKPGTLVAVEPMLAVGTGQTLQKRDKNRNLLWPIYSADGSLTAHYEHDVLITDGDPKILTEGLELVRDEIVV